MPNTPPTANGRGAAGRRSRRAPTAPDQLDIAQLIEVLAAVRRGDFSVRMPRDQVGMAGKVADSLNDIIQLNEDMAREFERVSQVVGKEGRITQRASVRGAGGAWAASVESVNTLIADMVQPTSEVARVIGAVAKGDLSQNMSLDIEGRPLMGEFLRIGRTVNAMVDQLSSFASEVTRVAREVGSEGKLGGQARVKGVAGTWKDLTDNVNSMASNLTAQVRGIAAVVAAVATGDLRRKLTLQAKGEIAALADTINGMIETLATFADQVTGVAREVGIEGKLGGQARVPGAAGTWRDLTDNVNQLAANLTTQVRAIAEVATAVTEGDLTRSITVSAAGEVAALKDNINEMIRNLKDQTLKNTEQDWLKTNLARFTRMLQGERDLATVSNMVLSELAPLIN
ncbi:MAG TPA: HAMP domain-containing protein, partial [Gemmatimonadales bacterium]